MFFFVVSVCSLFVRILKYIFRFKRLLLVVIYNGFDFFIFFLEEYINIWDCVWNFVLKKNFKWNGINEISLRCFLVIWDIIISDGNILNYWSKVKVIKDGNNF